MKGRSQSAAIRSQCLECCGYVLEEVQECTDQGCPLYPYRITGRKVPAAPGTAKKATGFADNSRAGADKPPNSPKHSST
jgi:hypothetical protein